MLQNLHLTNYSNSYVLLQTLRVTVHSDYDFRKIRALIDTGFQRLYILRSTIEQFKYPLKRAETIIHRFFGGSTCEQKHTCYDIMLKMEIIVVNLKFLPNL